MGDFNIHVKYNSVKIFDNESKANNFQSNHYYFNCYIINCNCKWYCFYQSRSLCDQFKTQLGDKYEHLKGYYDNVIILDKNDKSLYNKENELADKSPLKIICGKKIYLFYFNVSSYYFY